MTDKMRDAINNFVEKFEQLREAVEEDEDRYTADDAIEELEEALEQLKEAAKPEGKK